MRSGYSTTTSKRKNTTLSPINRCLNITTEHSWFEDHALYLVGPKRVLFIMSCWNLAIPLRAIGISYNWFVWVVHCEKNGRNTSKDIIKLFFFMTTLDLMSLKSLKNIWKRSNEMFYRTRRILRTLLLLITGCSKRCSKSPVHFFRRNRKLDRLQRRHFF